MAELTAVGRLPPVTQVDPEPGASFGVAFQRQAQTLQQVVATVTGPVDAGLQPANGSAVTQVCH